MKWRVKVPATSANLGPGFDSLGLALQLWNEAELEILPGSGQAVIEIEGEGAGMRGNSLGNSGKISPDLPADESHLIYQVLANYCAGRQFRLPRVRISFLNRLPLARGLGSSAGARVTGIALGQLLVDGELDNEELIAEATRLEGHPDNVAPAVLGGLVASMLGESGVLATPLALHPDLQLVVTIPEFQLETEMSRKALPATVPHRDAVFNLVRLPLLLAALEHGRSQWLQEVSRDVLHQPYRVDLVPGLRQVFQAAIDAGAAGVYLSGAGPTVAAWVSPGVQGESIGQAMQKAFAAVDIASRSLLLPVDNEGVQTQRLD